MGVSASVFSLEQVREFYDPHPNFVGSEFSFPKEVKEVADQLNGQKMSVNEALKRIIAIRDNDDGWKVLINSEKNFLGLKVYIGGRFDIEHTFCVIKFR